MPDEFVDLYETLELPIETDRNTLRKRINELYLDAQRNIDHRNFQTRIKFQELFEVTLPQARYILLDEGRRDDYDRLVRAYRRARGTFAPVSEELPATEKAKAEKPAGTEPEISPLPTLNVDPVQLAKEREELWSKWKTGLESAMAEKEESGTKPLPAPARSAPAHANQTRPAAKRPGKAVVDPANGAAVKTGAVASGYDEDQISQEDIDRRRDHRRREVIKETLVNIGLIWSCIGAAVVLVPGVIVLILGSNFLFASNAPHPINWLPQSAYWTLGLGIFIVGACLSARRLSRSKRQHAIIQMSNMPYEQLLRHANQSQ